MTPKIALLVYLLLALAILALFLGTHRALSSTTRQGLGRWLGRKDDDWGPRCF